MRGDAGLTLVEVLVTLAIVGVLAGGAALALGPQDGRAAEGAARRLAARLAIAADTALVSRQPLLFAWDASGYGFLLWGGSPPDWRPAVGTPLDRHDLAPGLSLASGPPGGRLLVDPGGAGAPGLWQIAAARDTWAVVFDGVTPRIAPGAP